jgi:4-hydroxybenzoate polyprenyltransferase
MIVSEFSTISYLREGITTCSNALDVTQSNLRHLCMVNGHQQHHWALLILGLVAILMAGGSAIGRSRPAAFALLVIGLVVLGIALIGDRQTLSDKRNLDVVAFASKSLHGVAGAGYSLEILAGALAVLAGLARLAFTDVEE